VVFHWTETRDWSSNMLIMCERMHAKPGAVNLINQAGSYQVERTIGSDLLHGLDIVLVGQGGEVV